MFRYPACANMKDLKIYVDIDEAGMKRKLRQQLNGNCQLVDDLETLVDVIVTDVFIGPSKQQKYENTPGEMPVIVTRYCVVSFVYICYPL